MCLPMGTNAGITIQFLSKLVARFIKTYQNLMLVLSKLVARFIKTCGSFHQNLVLVSSKLVARFIKTCGSFY
jgi:hypothetical protein